jgi:hypothetical protein
MSVFASPVWYPKSKFDLFNALVALDGEIYMGEVMGVMAWAWAWAWGSCGLGSWGHPQVCGGHGDTRKIPSLQDCWL